MGGMLTKQKLDILKKGIAKYRKTIIRPILNAYQWALLFSWFPALYKIKSLDIGEYAEEPVEVISARMQEMRSAIIWEAVVRFFLLTIIFYFLFLFYWFKRNHNINLIQKLRTELFPQKTDSKDI